jgi:hypothetical protein
MRYLPLVLSSLLLAGVAGAEPAATWKPARQLSGGAQRTQSRVVKPSELSGQALAAHQSIQGAVQSWGDTPNFQIALTQPHLRLRTLQHPTIADPPAQPNYATPGMHAKLQIDGAKAGEEIELVVVMPVSGHHNLPKDTYARTNRYDIWLKHPDGAHEMIEDVATPFVSQPLEGYATPHLLKVKLQPGSTMLTFAPRGSAGVGGYMNGRTIELVHAPEAGK